MKLYLLRHALAKDSARDELRPLSDVGLTQINKLCESLSPEMFFSLVQIWHSPYLRAVQTAKVFRENLGLSAPCVEVENIRPSDSIEETARSIAAICAFGSNLMIVGHNPHLEKLANLLLGSNSAYSKMRFLNCSLACFDLEEIPSSENKYGVWSLDFFFSPQMLGED